MRASASFVKDSANHFLDLLFTGDGEVFNVGFIGMLKRGNI